MAQVTTRPWWAKRAVGIAFGGTAAAFAAPVVAAVISGGILGMSLTGITTGVIGSTFTQVTNNIIGADDIQELKYNPHNAGEAYRDAIANFLRSTLDPVFNSIRRNRKHDVDVTLESDLGGSLHIVRVSVADASMLFIRIVVHIKPKAGTHPRDLEEGVPPPALPVFQRVAEQVLRLPRESPTLLTGVPRAVAEGALAGALLAPMVAFIPYLQDFHFFKTVPRTNLGVSLGLPTCTGITGSSLALSRPPASLETMSSFVDFAAELNTHLLRVKECGQLNGVDTDCYCRIRLERSFNAGVNVARGQGVNGANKDSLDFILSAS